MEMTEWQHGEANTIGEIIYYLDFPREVGVCQSI